MKRNIKKIFSLLLAAIMCLSIFALVACDNGSVGGNESESESESDITPEQTETKIPVASLAEYYIVRPDIQNENLLNAVKDFNKTISEKLSVNTRGITTDFILEGNDLYKEHEYEIVIGSTNREVSASFAEELKYKEYGYAVVGTKIVIAGISVEDTVLAIEKFVADVIDTYEAGSADIVLANDKYICKAEFKFDTLSINGVDISEYDIVYKKTKKLSENEVADALQDSLGRLCGVKIKTVLMNTTSALKEKQIVISDAASLTDAIKAKKDALLEGVNTDEKAIILADENVVWLYGDNVAALLGSMENLLALFNNSADGSITLETGLYDIANTAIKFMSYNVLVGSDMDQGFGPVAERKSGVVKTILTYAPDVFGVQEASNEWMAVLKQELTKYSYASVGVGRDTFNNNPGTKSTGEHCAIFYNSDKYNLIESNTYWLSDTPNKCSKYPESDYIRIFTYAILERKSDGFRFMHVNTHLDFNSALQIKQVNKLLELVDAVGFDGLTFATGDFNMNINASAYQLLLDAGFVNAFDLANVTSERKIDGMIDFCFVRNGRSNSIVEYHHVANDDSDRLYNVDMFPSDHQAVIATVVPVIKENFN